MGAKPRVTICPRCHHRIPAPNILCPVCNNWTDHTIGIWFRLNDVRAMANGEITVHVANLAAMALVGAAGKGDDHGG